MVKILLFALLFLLDVLVCFLFRPGIAWSAQTLVIDGAVDSYPLGGVHLDILEDKTGLLTIADVSSLRFADAFTPSRRQVPNFGMTDSAYWVRFTLRGDVPTDKAWMLYLDQPVIDEADLYTPRDDGRFKVSRSGVKRPYPLRDIPEREMLFPLFLKNSPMTFYIRIRVQGRSLMPLEVVAEKKLRVRQAAQKFYFGVYTGFMVCAALIVLFVFFLLRDRACLLLGVYTVGVFMSQLWVQGYVYLIMSPDCLEYHDAALNVFLGGLLASIYQFSRTFLITEVNAPRFDRALKWFARVCAVFIPLSFFLPPLLAKQLLIAIMPTGSMVSAAAAVTVWKKGFKPARYFFFSRFAGYTAIIATFLSHHGLISQNPFNSPLFFIVSMCDVLFVAIALSERFSMVKNKLDATLIDLEREIKQRTQANLILESEMAQRKKLEREIVKISDEERRNISHALHDGLCQQLVGARLRFAVLEDRFSEAGMAADVKPLGELLDETVNHAYALSRGLWITDSRTRGVRIDMHEFAGKLASAKGMTIHVEQDLAEEICATDTFVQMQLIAREAIMNAVKHADATRVDVDLRSSMEGMIALTVTDNGRGLSGKGASEGGMGMRIMRHRSEMIGGSLRIEDRPEGGVIVFCSAQAGTQQGNQDYGEDIV